MKKLYLSICMSLFAAAASAQTFTSGALTYNVPNAKYPNVTVSGCNAGEISTEIEIPETVSHDGTTYNVTKIGDLAFQNCTQLKSLTIPSSVTSIGKQTFYNSDLETIVCKTMKTPPGPPGLDATSFNETTYANATVKVYAGQLAYFKDKYDSNNLWSKFNNFVTMPDPPLEVNGLLFEEVSTGSWQSEYKLVGYVPGKISENLVIPEQVTKPGMWDMYVTSVGDGALEGAPIKSVTFPRRCTTLGARVFANCTQLEALSFPTYITKVGAHLTDGCVALKTITIESYDNNKIDFGTAADGAFATLTDYTLNMGRPVTLTGTAEDSPFAGAGLTHVIYSYNGSGVSTGLFAKSIGLKSVEVSRSVSSVDNGVFRGAPALETVTLTDALKKIGEYTFADCPALKAITLPENLTGIGAGAFSGMTMEKISSLAAVPPTLPDNAFSDETFAGATLEVKADVLDAYKSAEGWKKFANIVSDNLPDPFTVDGVTYTVQSMADKTVAITGYDAATMPADLVLPTSVVNDGIEYTVTSAIASAFDGAPMTSVKFPSTITLLPKCMLANCPNLETIIIPASVTKIEGYFFDESQNVKELIFEPGDTPINLGELNDKTIPGFDGILYLARPIDILLDRYNRPNSPLYWRKFAKIILYPEAGDCTDLLNYTECLEVEFTEGWTAVPAKIFSSNKTVSKVSFPTTLTSIGTEAFSGCSSLKEVTFPESLESMESKAFAGSTTLTTVSCKGRIPATINADVFAEATYTGATLRVLPGAKQYYNAADGWKNFANIVEDGTVGVNDIVSGDDVETTVVVTDMQGRTVYSGPRADMPALTSGIYIVRCGEKVSKILVK
ncbi:MAG: leucine-rich repeat protein [Muribaculaceae bacterium]